MKKLFAILLLFLLSVCGFGQSNEANKLFKQGQKLFKAQKVEEAIPYFQKSDSLGKAHLQPSSKHYYRAELALGYCFDILSMENYIIENYNEAVRLGTKAMKIYKKIRGEEHTDYASSLSNLASYNSRLGNYQEAIKLGTLAMETYKKTLGEEHIDYATSLFDLSSNYYHLGNYTEAIRLCTQAKEIFKKELGEEHYFYASSLNNLAGCNFEIGNYQEAIKLGSLSIDIFKKLSLGEEYPFYASALSNLASSYNEIGNYEEAIRLGTLAMNIFKQVLGEDHHDYAQSINNLANYYIEVGNYQEAIRLATQANEIIKNVLGETHPNYASMLHNLAVYNSEIGNFTETIRLETQAMGIYKTTLGEGHPYYALSLNTLAKAFLFNGDFDGGVFLFKQYYKLNSSFILKYFASMTNKERTNYWNKYSSFYSILLPMVANKLSEEPSSNVESTYTDITTLVYNGQLLSKGLLLNAEIEIQNLIEQSGDTSFTNRYFKIKQDRAKLDKLYQISPSQRLMNADSLSQVIDNEERLLVESSKELGDYTKNLSVDWKNIQAKLKENDVAIEFANFADTAKQTIYIALILKKGIKSPELVKLDFTDTDTADYSSPTLYNKIWKPLDKYLQDVSNVYFSPTGKFHTIGIEYLPDEYGEIFAKKYNAYRLSSTRELALEHVANLNKKASVYGGIVYNFDESDWQNIAEEDAERAGITFLKGAKKESEEINQILSDAKFDVVYGTDKSATEEKFKQLSGSGIKILHIATHGFYEPENKKNSFANMLSIGDKNSKEDFSLSRSGLFFAGANTALNPEQRKFIPDGVDDGILTAKEISRMDFKGLDLVVLSACQTGLGEVTSEGVFGLQRGFKKAGAQTIIMSLWKVNDKPTKELMTEFYRNLVAGKSKREAFISAQDKIRQKYIDPKMWAGFIMVDGIE